MDQLTVMNNSTCETDIITKVIDTLPVGCKTKFINGQIDIW